MSKIDPNPFKIEFDIKTGMILIKDNVRDGSVRFSCPVDEAAPIIEQMLTTLRKAEFIMANPLLAVKKVNDAISAVDLAPQLETMVDWYRHALLLLAGTRYSVNLMLKSLIEDENSRRMIEISGLMNEIEKIEIVLEMHRHNIPQSDPAQEPKLTDSRDLAHGRGQSL